MKVKLKDLISVQILTCWEVENNLHKTSFKYIFIYLWRTTFQKYSNFSEWITELITYMDDQHHDVWVSLRAVWNMTSCIFWNINMHTDHIFNFILKSFNILRLESREGDQWSGRRNIPTSNFKLLAKSYSIQVSLWTI